MSSTPLSNRETVGEIPLFADGEAVLHGVQELLGRKWQPVLVYRLLEDGPSGFSELKRSVDGISAKMLSESLADLEAAEIVTRTQVSEHPVRVEYALTECGRALEPVIAGVIQWGCAYDLGAGDSQGDPTGRHGSGSSHRSP
jgi:DNA-binding HxlR family transcriptional regulator